MHSPVLHLIVGINGAGKTTFYYEWLKPYLEARNIAAPFVNADEIQRDEGLGDEPESSYEAARLAAARRNSLIDARHTFATETVFSHPSKLELIDRAKEAGFRVFLYVLYLADPDLAVQRVRTRTAEGGHAVPEHKILARYARSLSNATEAATRVDRVLVYDTSTNDGRARLVISWRRGEDVVAYGPIPEGLRPLARRLRRTDA